MFEKLVYYFDKGPSIEDVGQFLRFLTPTLLRWQFFPTIRWQILDPFQTPPPPPPPPPKNANVLKVWSLSLRSV